MTAQEKRLSYEMGLNHFNYISDRSSYTSLIKGGFSPFIGVNYHLPSSETPISFGIRVNKFDFHLLQTDLEAQASLERFEFSNRYTYINFQMPISYHWTFGKSNLSAGIAPTLYFFHEHLSRNSYPSFHQSDILGSEQSGSHLTPLNTIANIDLTLKYSYFFSKIGTRHLGLTAFASFPILHNAISQNISHSYSITFKNGNKYSSHVDHYNALSPYTIGLGLTLK